MVGELIEKGIWKGWTNTEEGVYQKQLDKNFMVEARQGFFYLLSKSDESITGPFHLLQEALDYRPKVKKYGREQNEI